MEYDFCAPHECVPKLVIPQKIQNVHKNGKKCQRIPQDSNIVRSQKFHQSHACNVYKFSARAPEQHTLFWQSQRHRILQKTVWKRRNGPSITFQFYFVAGVRSSYSDPSSQYIIILFSVLLFGRDFTTASETFLVDYFVISIIYRKISEFLLKVSSQNMSIRSEQKMFKFPASRFSVAVHCNIHRTMANHMGFRISCIRPAL